MAKSRRHCRKIGKRGTDAAPKTPYLKNGKAIACVKMKEIASGQVTRNCDTKTV